MLQWMGGSKRKVTTSRKSTQNRQKQYFEQRKRRQQQTSGVENSHDVVNIGREHLKEHRSLDILSLLNISTIPRGNKHACTSEANTSAVQSHLIQNPATTLHNVQTLEESAEFEDKQYNDETGAPSDCYHGKTLPPMKIIHNDPDNHNNTKTDVDFKTDQGKTSVEQNLFIFDLLSDDGMIGDSTGSPVKEAHVAFSVEGLGRVGMETPACSPQHTGRNFSCGFSPCPKTTQPWNSLKNINMLNDLELEVDMIMQDINKPHDDSSVNYFIGIMDTCGNPKKSPAKASFQSVEECKRNKCYGGKSIFDGTDGGRDRWGGGFNFSDNEFLREIECNFFEKIHSNKIDSDSTDLLKYGKYDISENAFDFSCLSRKRGATRTMDEFHLFEPAKSSLKHHTSGYEYDLMSDAERNSRAMRISDFEDKSLQPDRFCSEPDDAMESFSLRSEESCSSSAVRGEAFNSTSLNSNPRHNVRRCRDGDSGPGNSCSVNSIYSREPRCKINDEDNQGDHAPGPGKNVRKLNSSKSKPVHHKNPPFMEKLGPFKSLSFEKECNLSSFCQNPTIDRPFRSSMPWTGDPCTGSAFPESSFTNKHGETVAHPRCSLISERSAIQPSNVEPGVIEQDLRPNSKLVDLYPDMAEATSSHGDTVSPVLSAQESAGKEEKSESKFPPLRNEKVNFQKEKHTGSEEVRADDGQWLDDSNYEYKNCYSIRSEMQNESPAVENLEASHYSDQDEETQPLSVKIPDKSGSAVKHKYNHDDEVSVPCPKGEKEVKDVTLERKTGTKDCSIDSSTQVMMLESYVLQLLFVQKGLK